MSQRRPAEVRRRVLEQHKTIRDRLVRLEDVAHQVFAERPSAAALRGEFERLLDLLGTHMRFEDSVLPGVLEASDAWGDVRVARFHDEHRRQREFIADLLETISRRDLDEVALLALGFAALLRRDMEIEERVFLDEDLLRDDPVVVEQEAG